MSSRTKDGLQTEKSCPLSSAHTRLRQAHELWHRLVAAYPEPDEFVLQLNQFVVTLRQVTFMLQKQKDRIDGFEDWYGDWQKRLRADPIMRWLHDARTHIEKRGDLDLASTARVELVASWMRGPYADLDVDPLLDVEELAPLVKDTFGDLPDSLSREGVLRVERRWVSKDFADEELTDVCAYGYGVMAQVLAEAHERLGIQMRTFGGEMHRGRHVRVDHLGGRLPCMVITDEDRTAYIHLGTGELLRLESESVEFDPRTEGTRQRERTEAMAIGPNALAHSDDEDPLDFGAKVMSVARRTLAHDGFHRPMAFLFSGSLEPLTFIGLQFEDQAEKYIAFRRLARDVEQIGADVVAFVGEAWSAPFPDNAQDAAKRAAERSDREEALQVIMATSSGGVRTYISPFVRDREGNPTFEQPTEVLDGERAVTFSLMPLFDVWARWRPQGSGPGSEADPSD